VTGFPFWNFAFGLSLKMMVLASGVSQLAAMSGE